MSDSTGSTKLSAQYTNGEWQFLVDNLTAEDVSFFEKLNPKIQEKLNSTSSVEQKRQMFRQEYEGLKDRVRLDPNFHDSGVEEVDIAVAMLVIKESVNKGHTDNLINRVGEVLSQSGLAERGSEADRLKEWKQSMPEEVYRGLAKDYVVQKFEEASQIRENIRAEREKDFDLAR